MILLHSILPRRHEERGESFIRIFVTRDRREECSRFAYFPYEDNLWKNRRPVLPWKSSTSLIVSFTMKGL